MPVDEDHPTNPLSPYGLSKLTGENIPYHIIHSMGFRWSVFVCSTSTVPAEPGRPVFKCKFIERIRNNQNPLIFGDGNQTRDFVYIEDVLDAIFNTMENKKAVGNVFNIGAGKPTRIKELAEIIIMISNKKLEIEFAPLIAGDIWESYVGITRQRKSSGTD